MILTDADFLPAILAHPFDDSPRLIYAEWLEDRVHESGGGDRCGECGGNGWKTSRWRIAEMDADDYGESTSRCDKCRGTGRIPDHRVARTEFIRVQCELSKPQTIMKWRNLKNRELELLQCPSVDLWLGDLNDDWRSITNVTNRDGSKNHGGWFNGDQYILIDFRRGFVSTISCTLAAFMRHASEIFSRHPVTEVRLTDREPLAIVGHFSSWCASETGGMQSRLPYQLWTRLQWFAENSLYWKDYQTTDAAQLALSHACVDYGRELVGLPPLNRPPETEETGTTA